MTNVHGRKLVVKIGTPAKDLSAYCDSAEWNRKADVHDVTGYGMDDHAKSGGLRDGTGKLSGTYDDTTNGPRAVLQPLIGQTVVLTRQPEGTGAGKPQDVVSVVIAGYTESHPVADMVKWSCDFELTGSVNSTAQSA